MHSEAIIVALIGLAGVLGSSVIANWDKLFPKRVSESAEPTKTSSGIPEGKRRSGRTDRR